MLVVPNTPEGVLQQVSKARLDVYQLVLNCGPDAPVSLSRFPIELPPFSIYVGEEIEIDAKNNCIIVVGDDALVQAGEGSTIVTGNFGQSIGYGANITAITGDNGHAEGGKNSIVLSGNEGESWGGDNSIVVSGDEGDSSGGENSSVMVGINGCAKGGLGATLFFKQWVPKGAPKTYVTFKVTKDEVGIYFRLDATGNAVCRVTDFS